MREGASNLDAAARLKRRATDIAPLPNGELLVVSHFSTYEATHGVYGSPHDTVVARLTLNPWDAVTGRMPDPPGSVRTASQWLRPGSSTGVTGASTRRAS